MPTQCFLVDDYRDPRTEEPGAISQWPTPAENVKVWILVLPNGAHWGIYGRMSDGSPGWDVTGELPNITARPSINSYPTKIHEGYHGWLTNGVLSDDLEGRMYM